MAQIEHNMRQPIIQETLPSQANNALPLKGGKVRLASGICIILTGIAEMIMTSYVLRVPSDLYQCEVTDKIAWGIWAGVFAIIAGCFGSFSLRSKCVVIAFMVLGIITAVISGAGVIFYASQATCVQYSSDYYYDYSSQTPVENRLHLVVYILLCLSFALQMLMSIIGASFTCVAVCPSSNPQVRQVVVCQPQQIPLPPTSASGVYPTVITIGQLPTNQSYDQSVPPPYSVIATQG